MSKFELFRTKMNNEVECKNKFETRFITEGAAPITIHILRLDKDRDATMVFTDTEGPDTAIVFTPKQKETIENLLKTDYYTWDNKLFFVYEDVLIAREVSYIKQKAYQCNVKVNVLEPNVEGELGGYFISSLRSYVDIEFQQKLNVTDKEQPVLIMPSQSWIKVGVKVRIGDKPWKVIDYDAITNAGITYMSLERDFFVEKEIVATDDNTSTLVAGMEYTFATQDGYFNSSSPLTIKSRTATQIVFEIPYGVESITIDVKQEGNIWKQTYKVVV